MIYKATGDLMTQHTAYAKAMKVEGGGSQILLTYRDRDWLAAIVTRPTLITGLNLEVHAGNYPESLVIRLCKSLASSLVGSIWRALFLPVVFPSASQKNSAPLPLSSAELFVCSVGRNMWRTKETQWARGGPRARNQLGTSPTFVRQ